MLNEALKKEVGEEAVPAVRRRRSKTQTLSILSGVVTVRARVHWWRLIKIAEATAAQKGSTVSHQARVLDCSVSGEQSLRSTHTQKDKGSSV